MKKLILLLAAVALATSVWAQDTPKKPSFAGFVSNGFWDNWEITLGGGAGTALSNGTNQGSFGDRINFEANFGLTKWFHPVTGMRLQLQGEMALFVRACRFHAQLLQLGRGLS